MNKETQYVKTAECQNDWYLVDAKGLTLGRFASRIALILQGKNKPTYTRAVDNGDYVVVINADKFKVTKNKLNTMYHNHYTGNIGGQYKQSLNQVLENTLKELFTTLFKNASKRRFGQKMLKKLKVYVGTEHPHVAQAPKIIQSL